MKVLVTGANGYIGQGVVKTLLDRGVEVIATDYTIDNIDARANVKSGDIFAIEDPYSYFEHPDSILHLAWKDGFKHESLSHIDDLPKHYKFLRLLSEAGISKITVMGSVHEVGFYEGSVDEATPCNPQSLYGIGKNALRQMTELLCKNNNNIFQWIRGYYIVGNTEYGCSIFSKISHAEKNGQKEFPFTQGLNQFDFIDYDIFCNEIADVVIQDEVNGIINCCSGRPEKIGDRVERFIKENGYNIELKYGAFPDRPYDSKAIWGCDEKIKRIQALNEDY